MIEIYTTDNGKLLELKEIQEGCWVHLVSPTEEEQSRVLCKINFDPDFIKAALDEEERSRLEVDDDGTKLILVDTPIVEAHGRTFVYSTLPFGIILTQNHIITVCLKETAITRAFLEGLVKTFSTKKKNRMTLQLLYRNATLFLFYLRQVDKASNRVENELHKSMKNKELIQMLGLEKSLVYFSTSLKGNEIVLEKLMRNDFADKFPDDVELLEDVIVENRQAIEMCNIYRDILSGTMDAFASVISNNLNIVMKLLTAITIIIAIPTLIASLWGMNVNVPFADAPFGFYFVLAISALLTTATICLMLFKKLF